MAITLTTMNGTDSVASSRITINDNFNTLVSALNDVLAIIDISTGKINNFGYGSNNDIETEDLIVRGSASGGISVITGNVNVSNGNVTLGGYVEFGASSGIKIEKITKNSYSTSGTYTSLNFTGVGTTGGASNVNYVSIPRVATISTLNDIQYPELGAFVYNTTGGPGSTGALMVCVESGVTGVWKTVNLS